MQRRKKLALTLAILLIAAGLLAACTAPAQPNSPIQLIYFYDNPCASCDDEEAFRALLQEQTEDLQAFQKHELRCVNMFKEGTEERDRIAAEKDMSEATKAANSMLVVGESVLLGDAIAPNLRQFYWQAAGLGTHAAVTEYYYRDDCPDCQEVASAVEDYLSSQQSVVRIDTTDPQTKAAFRALMEAESIPQERYQIPYLIAEGKHYSGTQEIAALAETAAAAD